ncbi:MAG TPA: ferritin-like domain-containing protein [Polyangiaceae bacterium]|jgi:hypothetical protein|nr:ferritin-like domain-containing protein [Polyangiaceae bacterium]
MNSAAWLGYFTNNQRPDIQIRDRCGASLEPRFRTELAASIARFQLGEASGGRIAAEVETARDPALDAASRRAIQLYVLEEGRHARELYLILRALGGSALSQHWSSDWFRRVRRCLGLRTKLLTMAAAEVVGITYYGVLRDRVSCPVLSRALDVIAREEKKHLDFQANWFARAIARTPAPLRVFQATGVAFRFGLILCAAVLCVLVDHRRVLAVLGVRPVAYIRACAAELVARRHFFQGSLAWRGKSSWISNQSAVEPTNTCALGPPLNGVSSVPSRTRTLPGAASRRVDDRRAAVRAE